MNKLIPKSKLQQRINSLKQGGNIPKYQSAGILKRIYYRNSPDYSKTESGEAQSFNDAYSIAKQKGDKTFWWTDANNNRNIYSTKFKLTLPTRDTKDYKDLRYQYLLALENPNMEGYDSEKDVWTPPKKKNLDKKQIGIGLDVEKNNDVRKFLIKNGRASKPWLTQQEMEDLMNKSLNYYEDVIDRQTKGVKLSPVKRAVILGLVYHGNGKYLWNKNKELGTPGPNGPKTIRINKAIYDKNVPDEELINAVTALYKGNTRADRHSQFWNTNEK